MQSHDFTTLTADGSTDAVKTKGGVGTLFVDGDFGGGTWTTEISPDGLTDWASAGTDGVATSDKRIGLHVGECFLRGTLSGSTSPNLRSKLRADNSDPTKF